MTTLYRLRTLGTAQLLGENDRVVLAAGKPLAIVVSLALSPGRRATRETLLDLLWSDVAPTQARSILRQTLFQLRRAVGDDVVTGSEELALSAAIEFDRDRFVAALERDDIDGALALYAGPFLPAFGVPGGRHFEEWAERERERLEEGVVRAADLAVRRLLNASQIAPARVLARRVAELAPQREAATRLAIEVALSAGDFVTASMEARRLEQAAEDEGTPLEAATRALLHQARQRERTIESASSISADDEPMLVPELTGREQEFAAITAAWQKVRRGPARLVHLGAPAGLGKTRLLRDVLARLTALGAPVVFVQGRFGDRDVPFAFLSDLAASLAELPGSLGVAPASASALVGLNPALSRRFATAADATTHEEALRRRVLALADLVHAVADEQRFVLAIDDLHWVDAESLRALEGLWPRVSDARVLALITSRPDRAPLTGSHVFELAPLTVDQVSALVESLADLGPEGETSVWTDDALAHLHATTGGSPLLVLETLRLALDQGVLSLDGRVWHVTDRNGLLALIDRGGTLRARVLELPVEARWHLCLLATASGALDRRLLAAAARTEPAHLTVSLETLERLGLIARASGGWVPAHDEIAQAARDLCDADERRRADAEVGRAFAMNAGEDSLALRRASRHLLAANDHRGLADVFRRSVHEARWRGDRRPLRELAAEMLALPVSDVRITPLMASIPLSWRAGLWSPVRQLLAAAVAAIALVFVVSGVRARTARLAREQRLTYVDTNGQLARVAIDREQWSDRTVERPRALDLDADRRTLRTAVTAHSDMAAPISPDGRSVAWTQDSGDSTTLDIWLHTPAGTRRLTRHTRDDVVGDWLPDGSALVGASSRWSSPEHGHYNIAVFDTASGEARAITHGDAHENGPVASPDGTRVAFNREPGNGPPIICVTAIDGQEEADCRVVVEGRQATLVGWLGVDELALEVAGNSERSLIAYDWTRRTTRTLLGPSVDRTRISRDRKWVVGSVRVEGGSGAHDWIVPVDLSSSAHAVEDNGAGTLKVRWWEGSRDSSLLIDRITFADSTRELPLGTTTRVRVRALSASGQEIVTPARVRWNSSDTTIARVDARGEVTPLRAGTTRLTASLAGWRTASAEFRVNSAPFVMQLHEVWDASWTSRWLPWGDPRPVVTTGPQGIAGLWNRGDASYISAAILRRAISAAQGLGVEVRVATPLTLDYGQKMRVVLDGSLDSATMVAADPKKALPSTEKEGALCGVTFPAPGEWGRRILDMAASGTYRVDLGATADTLRRGGWWTIRLQILPDGRCGVALNGRVIWLSPQPIARSVPYRLRLGDESVGTKLLHGPVDVWTGVRTDITWTSGAR